MKFSVKDLSINCGNSEGSLRSWISKGIVGKVYCKDDVNYEELILKLKKVYENDVEKIEKLLGCKLEEIEIVKGVKESKRDYVKIDSVTVGEDVVLWNYGFSKDAKLIRVVYGLYIFEVEGLKNEYKCYTKEYFEKDSIKIERF